MRGTEVLIGLTGDDLCPVSATQEYVARRAVGGGRVPLEAPVCRTGPVGVDTGGCSRRRLLRAQFLHWCGDSCFPGRNPRFRYPGSGSLDQACLPAL
jgi:hypothetical protein